MSDIFTGMAERMKFLLEQRRISRYPTFMNSWKHRVYPTHAPSEWTQQDWGILQNMLLSCNDCDLKWVQKYEKNSKRSRYVRHWCPFYKAVIWRLVTKSADACSNSFCYEYGSCISILKIYESQVKLTNDQTYYGTGRADWTKPQRLRQTLSKASQPRKQVTPKPKRVKKTPKKKKKKTQIARGMYAGPRNKAARAATDDRFELPTGKHYSAKKSAKLVPNTNKVNGRGIAAERSILIRERIMDKQRADEIEQLSQQVPPVLSIESGLTCTPSNVQGRIEQISQQVPPFLSMASGLTCTPSIVQGRIEQISVTNENQPSNQNISNLVDSDDDDDVLIGIIDIPAHLQSGKQIMTVEDSNDVSVITHPMVNGYTDYSYIRQNASINVNIEPALSLETVSPDIILVQSQSDRSVEPPLLEVDGSVNRMITWQNGASQGLANDGIHYIKDIMVLLMEEQPGNQFQTFLAAKMTGYITINDFDNLMEALNDAIANRSMRRLYGETLAWPIGIFFAAFLKHKYARSTSAALREVSEILFNPALTLNIQLKNLIQDWRQHVHAEVRAKESQ